MSSWPRVAFVDAPSPSANTRLDLSTGRTGIGVVADGFSLGVPTFNGNPGVPGVDWGYREMSFSLLVGGDKGFAQESLQKIAREMLRETNWLLFQLQPASEPVWFKTYRGEPGSLSLDGVYDETTGSQRTDQWQIEIPRLAADPFARGELETLTMQAINNDPAAGSLACFARLPDIKGDAPALANIRLRYTNAQDGRRHMLATSPVADDYTEPITWQVGATDGWTAGDDTGASASDAAMSGGTYRPVTFTTEPDLTNRISGPAPSDISPGRYKVLARVARSNTDATFDLRFGVAIGFGYLYGRTVSATWPASAANKHTAWVDLGDFQFPTGAALADVSDEPVITPDIALQVGRTSASGSAWLDAILLVPVGDEHSRTVFVDYPGLGPASTFHDEYHDGDEEQVYIRDNTTGTLVPIAAPLLTGGFHLLAPGSANVVHFVEQTSLTRSQFVGTDVPDRLNTDAQMVVSYHPLYMHLAP